MKDNTVRKENKMNNITLCVPSRVHEDFPGGRFSYKAMLEQFSRMGFSGIDMSFESLSSLDDGIAAVLYSTAKKARELNISIPLCHLSFYMPDHNDQRLMAKYTRELFFNIDIASSMGIPLAVIHPIAIYSKEISYGDWVRKNIAFLSPIAEYARKKNVKLCIENMPSQKESPDNHLYGSCALNISSLAQKLGAGICWDTGHANISGFCQSEQMAVLKGKLDVLHIHDNDGKKDSHLLPYDGSIDWLDVAKGILVSDFEGVMSVEVSAWALPGDKETRDRLGLNILERCRRLLETV